LYPFQKEEERKKEKPIDISGRQLSANLAVPVFYFILKFIFRPLFFKKDNIEMLAQ